MLEARLRAPTTEQRDVLRARIILLAAEGRSTRSIARAARSGVHAVGARHLDGAAAQYEGRLGFTL